MGITCDWHPTWTQTSVDFIRRLRPHLNTGMSESYRVTDAPHEHWHERVFGAKQFHFLRDSFDVFLLRFEGHDFRLSHRRRHCLFLFFFFFYLLFKLWELKLAYRSIIILEWFVLEQEDVLLQLRSFQGEGTHWRSCFTVDSRSPKKQKD